MESERTEALVLLLSRHQDALFRYIFSLLPVEADARDVLQETSVALCRKFSSYDASQPFLPWACKFAWLEILKHRESARKQPTALAPDVLELLSDERLAMDAHLEARLRALDGCLEKLPAADREVVVSRYHHRQSAAEIMERFGFSRRTLFRTLDRIRRTLFDCVSRQIHKEGLA